MTIMIRLSEEEERQLAARASENGREISDYIHWLIERDIRVPSGLDRTLGPFREQVEESGMTDDELGDFFDEVREEVWKDKQAESSRDR